MSFTSIDSFSGRSFQLEVADVDVSPSSYATIGGLRVTGMTLNLKAVQVEVSLLDGYNASYGRNSNWLRPF